MSQHPYLDLLVDEPHAPATHTHVPGEMRCPLCHADALTKRKIAKHGGGLYVVGMVLGVPAALTLLFLAVSSWGVWQTPGTGAALVTVPLLVAGMGSLFALGLAGFCFETRKVWLCGQCGHWVERA